MQSPIRFTLPHLFKNESSKPAKMLIMVAPAGLENMFFEVGVPLAEGSTSAVPPTREEIEKLLKTALKYAATSVREYRQYCSSYHAELVHASQPLEDRLSTDPQYSGQVRNLGHRDERLCGRLLKELLLVAHRFGRGAIL